MKNNDVLSTWNNSKHFLQKFTSADINNPRFIKLTIDPNFDIQNLDKKLKEVIAVSQRSTSEPIWPIWEVANENLEKAIQGLHNSQSHITRRPVVIELKIWYSFKFLDITKFNELPNQETQSHIEFIFSKKHMCSPCLIFPFTDPALEFWDYLDTIKPMLPFELDETLLRKMNVKNGAPSSLKKIGRPR
jgi:hypothetical protein